jgi:type IV pilus assembly protein PilZ
MAQPRNRRKHPRVRARDLAAQILTSTGRLSAQVENISRGGAFVRTDRPLDVGADVMIELAKPGLKRMLTVAARVTSRIDATGGRLSRRVPGMGMMFVSLDARQTDRLIALLQELGASPEGELTLGDDATELELQALALDDVAPMATADQPLWQQTGLAEREAKPAAKIPTPSRPPAKFELPRKLAEDIEGALRDADLPPPAPLEMPYPPPKARAPPVATEPPPLSSLSETEATKLMLQIRGLVMQLSDAQQQLTLRDQEIERLREELDNARAVRDAEIERLRHDLDLARAALQRALRNG